MNRPQSSEYNAYYSAYIDLVGDGDILGILATELATTLELLGGIDPARSGYRYAPEKWTLSEVVGHMVDTERVFGFRAFWIARGDKSDLPGMEQDDFARESGAANRSLASWLEEFEHLRCSHLALFRSFDDSVAADSVAADSVAADSADDHGIAGRKGLASGCEFTVRSFPYIMAGHEIHHRRVIQERYLTP